MRRGQLRSHVPMLRSCASAIAPRLCARTYISLGLGVACHLVPLGSSGLYLLCISSPRLTSLDELLATNLHCQSTSEGRLGQQFRRFLRRFPLAAAHCFRRTLRQRRALAPRRFDRRQRTRRDGPMHRARRRAPASLQALLRLRHRNTLRPPALLLVSRFRARCTHRVGPCTITAPSVPQRKRPSTAKPVRSHPTPPNLLASFSSLLFSSSGSVCLSLSRARPRRWPPVCSGPVAAQDSSSDRTAAEH